MAEKKIYRSSKTGRFVATNHARKHPVTVFMETPTHTSKTSKIGSHTVRTVDSKRFREAARAANTAFKEYRKK